MSVPPSPDHTPDVPLPRRIRDVKLDGLNLTAADQPLLNDLLARLNDLRSQRYTTLRDQLSEAQVAELHALLDADGLQMYLTGLRRASRFFRPVLQARDKQLKELREQLGRVRTLPTTPWGAPGGWGHNWKIRRALPHHARADLTGWLSAAEGHIRVNGVRVRGLEVNDPTVHALLGTRVHLSAVPHTDVTGHLRLIARQLQPASGPNGTAFVVVGSLARVDPSEGLIRVRLYPGFGTTLPRLVVATATAGVLAQTNPEWFSVRLTGRLLHCTLLADAIEPVIAPRPDRWAGWRNRRKQPDAGPLDLQTLEGEDRAFERGTLTPH